MMKQQIQQIKTLLSPIANLLRNMVWVRFKAWLQRVKNKETRKETLEESWSAFKDYFYVKEQEEAPAELTDFVEDADLFILNQTPVRGMVIIRIAIAVVVVFFLWAAFTNVNELVKGDGKVVPSSQLQVLQSIDGGIVQQIFIKEGDKVKADQPLLQIDTTRFLSSVRENQAQNVALSAKNERLNALLENRPFHFPTGLTPEQQQVFEQEQRYYENARFELQSQISISKQQLLQKQQELTEAQAKQEQLRQLLDSASHELKITKPLLSSGAVSEVDLLRLERDVSRYSGDLAQTNAQISKIQAAIGEAQRKVDQVELEYRNNLRKDLSESSAKLNASSEGSVGLEDKLKQSVIRSPMNGYVKRLLVNTVGGVVTAGRDIVEVVPSEDTLMLEAKVQPRDIAFLRVNQNALVKFTAYDFSVYGGMQAKLVSIGADSITDEKQNTYFLVKLRTTKAELRPGLPIIPGMQAEVDIETGKKSVLSYLLKPILRAHQAAFTER